MTDRTELNARLRTLGEGTPYSHSEWAAAAMHLGDKAEAVLPALEELVRVSGWRPTVAAMQVLLVMEPHAD